MIPHHDVNFSPQKVLICQHGEPTSVCFSPLKASLAFAGMDDGAVCVWNLREAAAKHREVSRKEVPHQEQGQQWIFRYAPTSTMLFCCVSSTTLLFFCY